MQNLEKDGEESTATAVLNGSKPNACISLACSNERLVDVWAALYLHNKADL